MPTLPLFGIQILPQGALAKWNVLLPFPGTLGIKSVLGANFVKSCVVHTTVTVWVMRM